ncbi:autotransporter adhesin [[Pasteurella] mairii]|uniref:Autotransporter adhesin n=1 Tax=[Pasteurella] mairii TaxID=757 RepID=A0A379B6T9_9PAST|nr:autotransporter adhesin [[Pasteurella] mairii]SUB33979.1 autotransporter adhesin [[Pasteurella] mairii]
MNKIFKVIWNHATQHFVVVSELSKLKGKSASSTDARVQPSKTLVVTGLAALMGGGNQ